jgi:cellulose synthase (UDP-forming)
VLSLSPPPLLEDRAKRPEPGVSAALPLADWTNQISSPAPESRRSRLLAHLGGIAAIAAVVAYLIWRVSSTLPAGGADRTIAWLLIAFEAIPVVGLVTKTVVLWNIDAVAPPPTETGGDRRVVLMIPTYNEPIEVIAPTIAAACRIEPAHETWVLDDGDRPWVADLCAELGARYIARPVHDHAKAGNMNHALALLQAEDAGDVVAVVDCDHVPLPTFLTASLGWFDDGRVALVQGPQAFYNAGAFDDDGYSGEQGLFFNVLMPSRQASGVGPFWCGSTALLRVSALKEVGGIATETITEDMHTTIKLQRLGWRTVYHHQTLAVGLAPATPDQYLLQRRRWGMGAMQILIHERLWAAKRWMSWRNFYEYLAGTMWWLEGLATLAVFAIPIAVLVSGAHTSTAPPAVFAAAFVAMFATRLWGCKRLMRGHIRWSTAFALRVFRVPVGLACVWWLLSRKTLQFEVTPKGASDQRLRGRAPGVLWVLLATATVVLAYSVAGVIGIVPWSSDASSTTASGVWLAMAGGVLVAGTMRIRAVEFATSRRNAHRVAISAPVTIDGVSGELLDISVGGAGVRLPAGLVPTTGLVELALPGAAPIKLEIARISTGQRAEADGSYEFASLRVGDRDWAAYAALSQWMFHTPDGAVPGLPHGVPLVGCKRSAGRG